MNASLRVVWNVNNRNLDNPENTGGMLATMLSINKISFTSLLASGGFIKGGKGMQMLVISLDTGFPFQNGKPGFETIITYVMNAFHVTRSGHGNPKIFACTLRTSG